MQTVSYKMLGLFNRTFKVKVKDPPPDVEEIFATYADGGSPPVLTTDRFLKLLIEVQGEWGYTIDDVERIKRGIYKQREEVKSKETCEGVTLDDFYRFLLCDAWNGPVRLEVHNDMSAPLHHYFIFTGHNSYLTGNQLTSDCSHVPIIKALQKGVKVIELDLWPNPEKNGIDVLHGRTLTTPVPLINCLESIKEYAFVKSPYPLILTLEDHLTSDLQAKVAKMVFQLFGDMLYYPETESLEEFPSPESLKYRIILTTKQPDMTNNVDGDQDIVESETLRTPQYHRLIAIYAGKPINNNLKQALKVESGRIKRLSLSESQLEKAAEDHPSDLVRFTQKHIIRVYPKGTRVTSSNFKPLTAWMHGAQMVAANIQGYGQSLCIMQGMFRANGGCGYVKKPDFLLKEDPEGEVFEPKLWIIPVRTTLKVNVYYGEGWHHDYGISHFDSYSPPDFYVKLYILGVPRDLVGTKTRVIKDDWAPDWNEEFNFELTVPELALIRIVVREYNRSEKDEFGGETCLPVWELKKGIRAVPLYDKKGEKLNSVKLLMRFEFVN